MVEIHASVLESSRNSFEHCDVSPWAPTYYYTRIKYTRIKLSFNVAN